MAKDLSTIPKLKKEYWRLFSLFIRQRDRGVCFTCEKIIPDYFDRYGNTRPGWRAAQAGHFVTAGNCGIALYFHEMNVHCQCHRCNVNLSGNWLEYERKMIEVYGKKSCEMIKNMKFQSNEKWSKEDYKDKIEKMKLRLVSLGFETK